MPKHEYSVVIKTANFEIKISPATMYGYFEHDHLGEECSGGLWFDTCQVAADQGLELFDCDGTPELPGEVKEALAQAGYIVGEEF